MKLTKFVTSRSTVIVLLSAISSALLVASAVPQRSSSGGNAPEWVARLPEWLHFLTSLLGIDNIVGTVWFAILMALFWLSLVLSLVNQYTSTRAQLDRIPAPSLPPEALVVELPLETVIERVAAAGFRPLYRSDSVIRFVKNPLGYWGNFLLHIGLVTAVFFSLVYVVTQHRVLIRMTGQEIMRLSPDTVQELRGPLVRRQQLPYSAVLKSLEARYWGNDKLEYLSSELYFTGQAGGDPRRVDVALSDKSRFGPYIVYQANAYGRCFDLEIHGADGVRQQRFFLSYPPGRDIASYGDLPLAGTDLVLKGKYFASPDHASIQFSPSPLTLRLYRGKELLGEGSLTSGGVATVGPLTVKLGRSEWWTDILLDGTWGTFGIFAGFALILVGVLFAYCLVPREILVRNVNGVIYAHHIARRFAGFYRDELTDIIHHTERKGEL